MFDINSSIIINNELKVRQCAQVRMYMKSPKLRKNLDKQQQTIITQTKRSSNCSRKAKDKLNFILKIATKQRIKIDSGHSFCLL
jgi:hypothetical protein